MLKKLVAGALLGLALGGCAAFAPNEQLPSGNDQVELTKEQGGKFLAFVGPKLQHTQPFLGVEDTNYYCLRSWLDTRNGDVAHQLYVEDSYYGSSYKWDGVHDSDNKPLKFIPISRNEISCDEGCSYADEFAAALPEELLRARRDKGLTVIFTAATGKTLKVDVPARLIADELKAIDATRTALQTNAEKAQQPAPAPPPPATSSPAPASAASTPAASAPAKPQPALPAGTVVPAPAPAAATP
jgi:hypothetical protein